MQESGSHGPVSQQQPAPCFEPRKQPDTFPPSSAQVSVDQGRGASRLDIPQRLERKLAQYNASQSTYKRWLFEIVSWIVSATCMGAIIGILVFLKDQPLSKWPLGLTIVTILSKVASAALILPISEAIGQLKWAWFTNSKSKEIFDFEIFDKASRGPWGSLMLLFRTKGKSLAALGALLTLLLLAIDTFFQQVTDLPERWKFYGPSAVPKVVRYDSNYRSVEVSNGDVVGMQEDMDLQQAIRPFFYGEGFQSISLGNDTKPDIPLSCPTSKCEWEPYESLGVCSACASIPVSDILTWACLETRLDWVANLTGFGTENTYPNGTACGYFINATSHKPILMSGYRLDFDDSNVVNSTSRPGEALLMRTMPLITLHEKSLLYGGSINFKNVYSPILDALIVSAADGSAESVYRRDPPVVHECLLSWCVKTIKSSYSFANYEEEVINTFLNTSTEQPNPWTTFDTPLGVDYYFRGNINIHTPTTDKGGPVFGVSNITHMNTCSILDEVFPSIMTVAAKPSARPQLRIKLWMIKNSYARIVDFSPWLQPYNVTQHMERLATRMTNSVRSYATNKDFVSGQAFSSETFVSVKWEWLTFPLTLLFLCLIFLVATIRKTTSSTSSFEETVVWKTSAMPALIYSLPEDLQKQFTTPCSWTDSSNLATKNVKVELLPGKGWRVSVQACPPNDIKHSK